MKKVFFEREGRLRLFITQRRLWSSLTYFKLNISSNTCRWSVNLNNIKCMLNNLDSTHTSIAQFPSSANRNIYFYPPALHILHKKQHTITVSGLCFSKFNHVLWKSFHSSVYRALSFCVILSSILLHKCSINYLNSPLLEDLWVVPTCYY